MNDKTKPDMLLWIDVETTALSPAHGQLLEVGMALTDMQGKEPPDEETETGVAWRWLIQPSAIRLTPDTAYAITELHMRNNLINEVFDFESETSFTVAEGILNTLNDLHGRYTLHPAGTNVDFDIEWIERGLGVQLTMLNYRKLDLTTLRFLMQQIALGAYATPDTDHRVMTCLNRDIQEYKTILDKITALADLRDPRKGA